MIHTKKKALIFLAKLILRFPIHVFVVSCIVGAVSVYFASKIKLDPSLDHLLPVDHKIFEILDEVKKTFGHQDIAVIVVRSDSLKQGEAFIEKAAQELAESPEIIDVSYKISGDFFKRNLLLYAEKNDLNEIYNRAKRKIDYEKTKGRVGLMFDDLETEEDPGFVYEDITNKYKDRLSFYYGDSETDFFHVREKEIGNENNKAEGRGNQTGIKNKNDEYDDQDKHLFVVTVKPQKPSLNVNYSSEVMSMISETIERHRSEFPAIQSIEYTGRYQKKIDSIHDLVKNFKNVTVVSLLGVILVLTIFFRTIRPVILIAAGLIYGIFITLGLAQIFIGTLNLISTFLIGILIGLGIDFGIHIILRYKEEKVAGKSLSHAFTLMYTETGLASTAAVTTTAIAFGMLGFSNFAGFSDFGFVGSMGILSTLFAYMTFMASLLIILTRYFNYHIILSPSKFHLSKKIWQHPKIFVTGCLLLTFVSVIAASNLQFDYDFTKVLGNQYLPAYKLEKEVNDIFKKNFKVPSVILVDNADEEKKVLKSLEEITDTKEQKKFISISFGLSSFIPEDQTEKLSAIKRIKYLVQTNRKYINRAQPKYIKQFSSFGTFLNPEVFAADDLPDFISKRFQPIDPQSTKRVILIYPSINAADAAETLEFSDRLNLIQVNSKPLKAASDSLIFAEILRLVREEGLLILSITFLAIYMAAAINLKSFSKSLIVFLPIVIGLVWMIGMQGLLEIKNDFINVIAYPIIIGIGIDGSVHLYHRYMESKDIIIAMRSTGKAVTLASATTAVAFGSLLLGQNKAIVGLGLLSIVGITMTYLSCIFALPAILSMLKKKK